MKVLIIEDEFHAAKRLKEMISKLRPHFQIIETLDTVASSIHWFNSNQEPDLIFQDINLGDGLSFDIFKSINVNAPIIFTTAFDEYAIRAFKTNSVDYLLKPIDEIELSHAVQKFEKYVPSADNNFSIEMVTSLLANFEKPKFLDRVVAKSGTNLQVIKITDASLFFSDQSITFLQCQSGSKHMISPTLDQLQNQLDPNVFFRINRANIIHIDALKKVSPYFNNRLAIETTIAKQETLYVSRERVRDFKIWLGDLM